MSDIYMIVGPSKWGPNYPKIIGFRKKNPKLKTSQSAFKLEIKLPNNLLTPPSIPVALDLRNVIRPAPEVKP